MFDWRLDVLVPVILAAIVAVTGVLFSPLRHYLERVSHRVFRRNLVSVEVREDPAEFLAGTPDWEPFAVWVPSQPSAEPPVPESARLLLRTMKSLHGEAALWQVVEVRLSSRVRTTVEGIEVSSESIESDRRGCIYAMSVGGGELLPHAVDIDLSVAGKPTASVDFGGQRRSLADARYALAPGETEAWIFRAAGVSRDQGWWLNIRLRADGLEWVRRVPKKGMFLLRSADGRPTRHAVVGGEWETHD